MARVRITLTKSLSGRIPRHRDTIHGLGLRRMWQSVEHEVTPQVAGMIDSVRFMLDVKECDK